MRCKKDGCSLYCNGTGMHSFVCEYQDWTVVNLFLNDNDLTELAVDDIRDCYENVRVCMKNCFFDLIPYTLLLFFLVHQRRSQFPLG